MDSQHIIIVDKSPPEDILIQYFKNKGFNIIHSEHPITLQNPPAAIILDWTFLQNRLEVITQLHEKYTVPLIVMHDFFQEDICIKALEAGADTFICKPLVQRELHARIIAVNRRIHIGLQRKLRYQFSEFFLCPASRRVFDKHNQTILLSPGEYDLLYLFLQHGGQILSRESLMQHMKQKKIGSLERSIDVQIGRLRQKIESNPKKPLLIKTVRNGGYIFTPEVAIRQGVDPLALLE